MAATATQKVKEATKDSPEGVELDDRDRLEAQAGARGAADFDSHDPEEDDEEEEEEEEEGEEEGEDDELEAARSAAVEAGMTASEAADFTSAAQLHKATAALRRQADSLRAAAETAKAGSVSGSSGSDAGRKGDPGAESLEAEIDAIIEEEEVSPKMAALLKKLGQSHAALSAKVNAPAKEVPVHAMDFAVGGLAKGYAELFGEGPGDSLPKEGVHRANRIKVIEGMERYVEQERKAGRPIPSAQKAFEKSLHENFGEAASRIESKAKGDAAKARGKRFLHRPAGSTGGPAPRGDRKALAGIRDWAANRGIKLKDDGAGSSD